MCLDDCTPVMSNFYVRLLTFGSWKGNKPAIQLAACEFYYLQTEDIVRCFNCGVEIYKWKPDDNILEDHRKFSPSCKFIEKIQHIFFQNNSSTVIEKNQNIQLHDSNKEGYV
uniref:Baculoviral IAP repeat-containing protein 8-like n=1 Tax=Diabrotica virgifera virgifera TaxID=50390 RepID=A0A6P7GVL0_DIAVI